MGSTTGPPSNWLNLPIDAREGIASILSECEKFLVWPHQVMQNAVALLGKSATDDRPISLTSLLYAVCVKIKKPVISEFDRSLATWWDSPVAGNSCLREGIRRRFVSEVACLNGKPCVDTFSVLEKFYDSIDSVKPLQQASQLKWDPVVLYMSLFVHLFNYYAPFGASCWNKGSPLKERALFVTLVSMRTRDTGDRSESRPRENRSVAKETFISKSYKTI